MITKVLGSINDMPAEERSKYHIEKVYVKNEDLAKRLFHLISDHHREISILLERGEHLRVGDILKKESHTLLVVDVLSEDVLVIAPISMRQMGIVAHNLGNRHLPAQFGDDTMIIQYNAVAEIYLKEQRIPYQRTTEKIPTPFRYIGHRHG
ncbi:MAG: urease accessory protein UreE [Sporolactobacillus sp.]|nr:urease accessory protein UreE [Sporolactobacillus sp.]